MSTMNRCGWLVGALVALLACPSASISGEGGPSNPDITLGPTNKLSTTCYFGNPSESCTYACNEKSLEAYCDEVKLQCLCREPENKAAPDDTETEFDGLDDDDDDDEEPDDNEDTQINEITTQKPKTNYKLSELCSFGYPSAACLIRCKHLSLKSYCDQDHDICVCQSPPDEGPHTDWKKMIGSVFGGESEEPTGSQNLLGQLTGSSSGINSGLFNLLPILLSGGSDDYQFTEEENDAQDSEEENDAQDIEEEDDTQDTSEQDDSRHLVFYIFDLDPLVNDTKTDSTPNTTESPSSHPKLRRVGKAIEGWAFSHIMAVVVLVFLIGLLLMELAACLKKEKRDDQMQSIFPNKK